MNLGLNPKASLAALGAGAALGVVAAILAVSRPGVGGQGADGWLGSRFAGSTAADPLTRAIIARTGLLALSRSETIYFTKSRDADGSLLSEECVYRIEGARFPARWWSVTLYAADNFLPRNRDKALSIDATRVVTTGDGRWSAVISPSPSGRGGGEWLSSRGGGRFTLTLRLYNPSAEAVADPRRIAFPRLTKLSCGPNAS